MDVLTGTERGSCLIRTRFKHGRARRLAAIAAIAASCLSAANLAAAADRHGCSAASGNTTAVLIELFTSEGCSSCPPADRWLAEIGDTKRAAAGIVPLAFHVDYWNHLGWEDPYAMPQFTQRQQRYAGYTRARTVYTPQVLLNGREFRAWRSVDASRRIAEAAAQPARAHITLQLQPRTAREVEIESVVRPDTEIEGADLYLALYERHLSNKVEDGENAGRTLHHDFVTRRLLGPIAVDSKGKTHHRAQVHIDHEWQPKNMGVAAFVQLRDDGEVAQALSLPLCF